MELIRKDFYGCIYDISMKFRDFTKILSELYSCHVIDYAILIEHIVGLGKSRHIHFAISFIDNGCEEFIKRLCDCKINFYELTGCVLYNRNYLLYSSFIRQASIFEIGIRYE